MTDTKKGGSSPAGATAHNSNAITNQRSARIYGVLDVRADDLDFTESVPAGVKVRVDLADQRWIDAATLARLAFLVWGAAEVEVAGREARAIADVVRHLRTAQAQQAVAEAEHVKYMTRWEFGSFGDAA